MDVSAYRTYIEAALAYAGGTHTYADVEAAIQAGDAQLWPAPNSCIVTELDRQPHKTILHFFLAAGTSAELEAMEPHIVEWGKEQGCTLARFVGRKGWERSFLAHKGWVNSGVIVMEKPING